MQAGDHGGSPFVLAVPRKTNRRLASTSERGRRQAASAQAVRAPTIDDHVDVSTVFPLTVSAMVRREDDHGGPMLIVMHTGISRRSFNVFDLEPALRTVSPIDGANPGNGLTVRTISSGSCVLGRSAMRDSRKFLTAWLCLPSRGTQLPAKLAEPSTADPSVGPTATVLPLLVKARLGFVLEIACEPRPTPGV